MSTIAIDRTFSIWVVRRFLLAGECGRRLQQISAADTEPKVDTQEGTIWIELIGEQLACRLFGVKYAILSPVTGHVAV
jgi:hypothetical protein